MGNENLVVSRKKLQNVPFGKTVELEIRKYKRVVFQKSLWGEDPDLVKSRGSVFIDGKQVVVPMIKTFNYGENSVGVDLPLETPVKVYRKYNGYMLNLTFVENVGWVISTTGDALVFGNKELVNKYLTMWQDMFKDFDIFQYYQSIADKHDLWYTPFTVTFEICHPKDVHIIDEDFGIYPLCYQANGKTYPIGEYKEVTIGELLEMAKTVKHEGFMVYNMQDELIFKLKTQFYLLKKWIQRGNSKSVYDCGYRAYMDEEFFPIVDSIRSKYSPSQWDELTEDEKSDIFIASYREFMESVRDEV